jgi:post-segregation antitoxin (ccd killing protein)
MTKVHLNACIDNEVFEAAKKAKINISQALEQTLRARTGDTNEVAKNLAVAKETIAEARQELQRLTDIVEGEELRLEQKKAEFFDTMPELQMLTPDQVSNSDYMLQLVGQLREKYNDRTISFLTLQKYLLRKAVQPKADPVA